MNLQYYTIAFLLGAALGSFANNLLSYYLRGSKFDFRRSLCYCGERTLNVLELIPIVSYLYFRGRCGKCESSLPKSYLLVELFSGILSVLIFGIYNLSVYESVIMLLVTLVVLLVAVIDLKLYIIPNKLLIFLSILILIRYYIHSGEFFFLNLACALLVSIGLLITAGVFKRIKGLEIVGMGDIKYIFLLMLLFNFPVSLISVWIASIFGLAAIYYFGRFNPDGQPARIPFGACLSLAVILIIFLPSNLLEQYYWSLLL